MSVWLALWRPLLFHYLILAISGCVSITVTEIEAQVRALSREDEADLVKLLIAVLDGPADAEVQRAWLEEAHS